MKNITKILLAAILLFLLPAAIQAGARTESARRAYIDQYKELAVLVEQYYGIPASIVMAQALLETDAGRSLLCEKAKNHFGIKVGNKGWSGPSMKKIDDKVDAYGFPVPSSFRMYDSAVKSYHDYGRMLLKSDRFAPLFKLPKNDYVAWASLLYKNGYATNPEYPKLLIKLIHRYDLHALNDGAYDDLVKKATTTTAINTHVKAQELQMESNASTSIRPVEAGLALKSFVLSPSKRFATSLGEMFFALLVCFFCTSGFNMYEKWQSDQGQERFVNNRRSVS